VFLVAAFGPRVCELTFGCAELCGVVHGCAYGRQRCGAILVELDSESKVEDSVLGTVPNFLNRGRNDC